MLNVNDGGVKSGYIIEKMKNIKYIMKKIQK